jgi:hypothetical protein
MERDKFPKEVKKEIAVLKKYTINDKLEEFQIIHLYAEKDPAFPNGFTDSRFFQLWGFNPKTMEKKDLGRKDAIYTSKCTIEGMGIFADGSTFMKFRGKVSISEGTRAFIKDLQKVI